MNWWAVLVSALISFVLGFLWFGPIFGKQWMKLSKIPASEISKAKQKSMAGPMILNLIGNIIMCFVLAGLISITGTVTSAQGAILGFWVWLGFVAATTLLSSVLWEGKSWGLFVLNGLYWLVVLLVDGAILAVWA